jgi:hypothetical protein
MDRDEKIEVLTQCVTDLYELVNCLPLPNGQYPNGATRDKYDRVSKTLRTEIKKLRDDVKEVSGLQNVSIKFKLKDGMTNKYVLYVSNNSFGVLSYQLAGANGIPHALSNMQCKRDFPATLDGYKSMDELVKDIKTTIRSGYKSFDSLVYAKSK